MEMCMEAKGLTKAFHGRRVVDKLSFSVNQGEVFGLLGHNGAGKSTTIEMMLGLKKPDEGSATIWGKDARMNRKEIFERVGVQLQAANYQNNIRVDEICREMSSLYTHPQDYHKLLEKFQMEELEKSMVNKLSGGEKQKLSVILALIPNPQIVFLDELTTGLDVGARRNVWKCLKELKEEGVTIFLTTHYMEEAENLCDRIGLLRKGKKIMEGTVEEVIGKSPYDNLEDAYLWYMGEEVSL